MGVQADPPVVQLEGVWKRYGQLEALRGISLECRAGELVVILGPSGAGKTTTLKLISGLESPDRGVIRLRGKVVNAMEPKDRNVALVFENYALYPHLTVFENIASPLRAAHQPASVINDRVHRVAEMLGIAGLLDRFPAQLSGGQRQRVSLGRALAKQAVVYLLDEPIAHLDAKLRHEVRGEFKRLQRDLCLTMVYVTHDYREALALADRVVVLNQGCVEQTGTPGQVYHAPANTTVARLLGDPPMNLVRGRLRAENGQVQFVTRHFSVPLAGKVGQTLSSRAAGQEAIVGIRPGDIAVVPRDQGIVFGECYTFEPLGTDAILTVKTGEVLLKVRVAKETRLEIGAPVSLRFNISALHLFDQDGRRLT